MGPRACASCAMPKVPTPKVTNAAARIEAFRMYQAPREGRGHLSEGPPLPIASYTPGTRAHPQLARPRRALEDRASSPGAEGLERATTRTREPSRLARLARLASSARVRFSRMGAGYLPYRGKGRAYGARSAAAFARQGSVT